MRGSDLADPNADPKFARQTDRRPVFSRRYQLHGV